MVANQTAKNSLLRLLIRAAAVDDGVTRGVSPARETTHGAVAGHVDLLADNTRLERCLRGARAHTRRGLDVHETGDTEKDRTLERARGADADTELSEVRDGHLRLILLADAAKWGEGSAQKQHDGDGQEERPRAHRLWCACGGRIGGRAEVSLKCPDLKSG